MGLIACAFGETIGCMRHNTQFPSRPCRSASNGAERCGFIGTLPTMSQAQMRPAFLQSICSIEHMHTSSAGQERNRMSNEYGRLIPPKAVISEHRERTDIVLYRCKQSSRVAIWLYFGVYGPAVHLFGLNVSRPPDISASPVSSRSPPHTPAT